METSQEVVKEIVDHDNKQIIALLDSMRHLVELLNNSYHAMQDFSKLAEKLQAPNVLTAGIINVSIHSVSIAQFLAFPFCSKERSQGSTKN